MNQGEADDQPTSLSVIHIISAILLVSKSDLCHSVDGTSFEPYRFRAPVEYIVLEGDGAVDVDRLLLQVCGTGECDFGLTRT
jgi:hypothetical protein